MRGWLKTRFNAHGFTFNEAARDKTAGPRRWLFYRRMFLHFDLGAPLVCRILGHRPVIGGVGPYPDDRGWTWSTTSRWVECARCDLRPKHLHNRSPAKFPYGSRYGKDEPLRAEWWPKRRCELRCEIALPALRLWWRDWTFGFKVGVGGSRESTVSIDLHVGPLSIYLRQRNLFGMRWARRTSIYWNPEVSFAVGRFDRQVHVKWCLWCDPSGPTGEKPVGLRPDWVKIARWRYGYFYPTDKLLGRAVSERTAVARMFGGAVLPEGTYSCAVVLERWTVRRPRWPRTRVRYGLDVTPDRPIPVPGNLDSDSYDGDDAIHGHYGPYAGPLDDFDSPEPAFVAAGGQQLAASVLARRLRHGGSSEWQPKQAATP